MGVALNRQIDKAIREVDILVDLVAALSKSLTALEGRLKVLEDGNRQRSIDAGHRRGPRVGLRD